MISDELERILTPYEKRGKMAFLDGATDEEIAAFEKTYSVSLPAKYKEWLRFSDGGECFLPAGVQFYGVAHKPVIDVTDNDRPNETYTVIGALATGDPILYEKGKEEISIFNHETGRIENDEVYPDFFAFLADLNELLGLEV